MAGTRKRRTPGDVLLKVREAILLGCSYEEIMLATGVSTNIIAEEKRQMGMLWKGSHKGRGKKQITDDLVAAIREAVRMEISYDDMKSQFGVSSATIADVKRGMGLLPQTSDTGRRYPSIVSQEQQPPQAPQAPQAPAQDAAPTAPEPGAYFLAIRDGILDGHAREQALEERVATLQSRIADLEAKNRELYDTLTQIRAQMSTWAGPAPIPHRNLSTGG